LLRDPHWVGGLAIDVTGWTGPLAEGTTPYSVSAQFNGHYLKEIVVKGSNKTEVVHVKEIPFINEEEFVQVFSSFE
jgi:hypothetical protein